VVVAVVAAIIFATGSCVVASLVGSVLSVAALRLSVFAVSIWCASVCAAAAASVVGAVVDSAAVVGFSFVSVGSGASVVGAVVLEAVSVFSGAGFSVVGSLLLGVEADGVAGAPVVEPSPETVVPEPPEALTVDVGPSPDDVDADVCEPDDVVVVVVVVVSVPDAAAPDVPPVPHVPPDPGVVAPDSVVAAEPVVAPAFAPVSPSGEPDDWLSPVLADASPCPVVATAIPRPTANARPLARLALLGRFACFPRLTADTTCSRLPRVADHAARTPGHEQIINCGET
jgi:hypothetical protein